MQPHWILCDSALLDVPKVHLNSGHAFYIRMALPSFPSSLVSVDYNFGSSHELTASNTARQQADRALSSERRRQTQQITHLWSEY